MVRGDTIVVEKLKSKYKLFLLTIKYLPYLVALLDVVNTFTSMLCIDLVSISYIGGISFLTIVFMLLTSFTFNFCVYHRLPIYYVLITNCISTYDYFIGIPIEDKTLLVIHCIILFIAILTFTILHIKLNDNTR